MKTMGERLKANYYVNKRLFIADMKRMITNCKVIDNQMELFFISRRLFLNIFKVLNLDEELFRCRFAFSYMIHLFGLGMV